MNSIKVLVLAAALAVSGHAMAADPSIDDIYKAQRAGHPDQAQQMIREVLRDHPNSAKAHYVDAELLAEQGQIARAKEALATAQQLAPGLPFVQPGELLRLQSRLSTASTSNPTAAPAASQRVASVTQPVAASSGISPVALFVVVAGIGFFIWLVMRFVRNAAAQRAMNGSGNGDGNGPYPTGYAPGYGPPPGYGAAPGYGPTQGGGLGSRVVGGLATGLAVGAGVMAAESIGHRLFGNDSRTDGASHSTPLESDQGPAYQPANDFGIQDSSTWDDGGSLDSGMDSGSSGSDWDT